MPTLPRNIAIESRDREADESCEVIPIEEPTVNNAEQASNNKKRGDICGSNATSVVLTIIYEKIDMATTAFARRIEPIDIDRLNAVTRGEPVTIALRL